MNKESQQSVFNTFPWNQRYWEALLSRPESMHHALLLIGPGGTGKSGFAMALAARLLCEKVTAALAPACGNCSACHWFAGGNHPDFRLVTLESEGEEAEAAEKPAKAGKAAPAAKASQIRIDQIRELEEFAFVGSHRHGNRVVVIDPADAMNASAANSILKLLEEPPLNLYFILISSNQRRLIPTLRSRCKQVLFGLPERRHALAWLGEQGVADAEFELALTGGAPLAVLAKGGSRDLIESVVQPMEQGSIEPLSLASSWNTALHANDELNMELLVEAVQKWLYDVICVKMLTSPRYLTTKVAKITETGKSADIARLLRCYADILKIRAVARHPLNAQLFLEDLASRYAAAIAAPRR